METIYFEPDKTYKMRIVCSHSKIRQKEIIEANAEHIENRASFVYNTPTIMMYNRSFESSTPGHYSLINVGENMKTVAYGSSFGPPVDASSSIDGGNEASFEPFTPPYYNGYSHLEISYKSGVGGYKTISDVLQGIETTSHRECIRSGTLHEGSTAGRQAMSLSASLNFKQIETYGNSSQWTIQPCGS